ncbi:MAG: NAD-dependent DNA ligase LigA, partial [Magnetococcales bacterium]|nr:NAD-dependent DNA ligase LigA [Magnetococcales bacterium]
MTAPTPDELFRLRQLRQELTEHNIRYHQQDDPFISDQEYDHLFQELVLLEEKFPELADSDSPTRRVGAGPLSEFAKVTHGQPMLSLSNRFSSQGVVDFDRQVRELLGTGEVVEYLAEPKLDGLAINLTYRNGILQTAATRGDGTTGEDVTQQVRTIPHLPLHLAGRDHPSLVEIRAEVFIPLAAFAKMNVQLQRLGEKTLVNARNAAAGAIRQLDPKVTARRPLTLFCYGLGLVVGDSMPSTQEQALQRLSEWGLPVCPEREVVVGAEGCLDYFARLSARRYTLP